MITLSPAISPSSDIALQRQLIPLPQGVLSADLLTLLDTCNALLASMPPCHQVFDCLQDYNPSATSAEYELLRHDLSEYINVPRLDFTACVSAERREALIYQHWCRSLSARLKFSDIQRLNALATGGNGALRTTFAYLASHDGCTRLSMVQWRQAHQRLTELPTLLNDGAFGNGLLAAVRVLALVNNAHAFVDGNGRLGRFLFNYCLYLGGMSAESYVPLKCLAALSEGGYEIRLREVELFDHWAGLITYHSHAVRLVHRWGQASTTRCNEQEIADVQ